MLVRDNEGNAVNPANNVLRKAVGAAADSGDNIIIDISALSGYQVGDRILITYVLLQNKSGLATEATLKDDILTESLLSAYSVDLSEGVATSFVKQSQIMLSPDSDLVLTLSAANSTNYSILYYLVAQP